MPKQSRFPSWIPTVLIAAVIYLAVAYASQNKLISDYWYKVIQFGALVAISALGLNLIYGFNGQFSLGHIGFYAIGAYSSALVTKDYLTKWSGSNQGALAWMIAGEVGIVIMLAAAQALRIGKVSGWLRANLQEILKPNESKVIVAAATVALAAVCVVVGVGGALLLQKALMVGLGALLKLPAPVAQNIIFLVALVNGGVLAALIGYLVGMPLLRLSSDYFGIATLGFSVMIYTALQNSDSVIATMKGARGMVEIPVWTTWGWVFGSLVVVTILMRNLVHSSQGRAIISIREDEIAAKTMGIDIAQVKAVAFTIGAFFAGLAGGLYAHLYGFLHPSTFNVIKGFDPLIIIVFGGLGSITGTILASFLFAGMMEGLRVLLPQDMDPVWRFVFYAILLLGMMLLRQQGLLGRTEWLWLKAPLPPVRDIPVPDRSDPSGSAPSARKEGQA